MNNIDNIETILFLQIVSIDNNIVQYSICIDSNINNNIICNTDPILFVNLYIILPAI